MNVLLVEPDYKNKFPPHGLLKIGAYHLEKGDKVQFFKGLISRADAEYYDRIYICTLFSFYHDLTVRTILHYKNLVNGDLRRIFVGGIYSTLYPKAIYDATGVYPIIGLLNKPGLLGDDEKIIDSYPPAYELLEQIEYDHGTSNSFIAYATRGCVNKCPFCAVPRLEPDFIDYIDIKPIVRNAKERFGDKNNLILMDNNVLASTRFREIIQDIKDLGFGRGEKLNRKQRTVDFNQGLEARLVTEETADLLAQIAINPLRLAYDYVGEKSCIEKAVRRLCRVGISHISTYVLYNFKDSPHDLYSRLNHVTDLSQELGCTIYSFPMRYTPLHQRDRLHVGQKWTLRQIRGLQRILNYAKGIVSSRKDLFYAAFGTSPEEFVEIIHMPDEYILQREKHKENGASEWRHDYRRLSEGGRQELHAILSTNELDVIKAASLQKKGALERLLRHHIDNWG
jgi:hypothetical protein